MGAPSAAQVRAEVRAADGDTDVARHLHILRDEEKSAEAG